MGTFARVGRNLVPITRLAPVGPPTDATAPATPTNLTATVDADTILLAWDANTENDRSHYLVFRSTTSPVDTTVLPHAVRFSNSYLDQTAEPSTTYHYTIIAVDDSNNRSAAATEANASIATPTAEVNETINHSHDDGDVTTSDSSLDKIGITVQVGAVTGGVQHAYLRFQSVDVPQGATITNATLTLQAWSSKTAAFNMKVHAEDADDSSQPAAFADVNAAPLTTAAVDWDLSSVVEHTDYESPDLSSVIQEVVDRVGWAQGGDLTLHLRDDGSTDFVQFKSFSDSTSACARLHIEFADTIGDAGAIILYVDQLNGSDANAGTSANPLKTINRAGEILGGRDLADRAGARVYLRGTLIEYNYKGSSNPTGRDESYPWNPSSWTFDGVEGDPVKIMTDPGEATQAVIDGSSVPKDYENRSTAGGPVLLWIHGSNIEVDNVIVQSSAGIGVYFGESWRSGADSGVHNCAIRNSEVMFCHGDGCFVSGDYTEGRGTNFIAENSSFHHNQDFYNDGNSASGLKIVDHDGGQVINCQSYKNSDDGVDWYGSINMIARDSDAWMNGYYSTIETVASHTLHGDSDLSEAPAANPGNGKGFKMSGGSDGADNVAHHCRAWRNVTHGFVHNTLENGLVYNCSTWNNGAQGFNFRNGTTIVGCAAVGDGAYFDNAQGDWPPNEYNSWASGLNGNPYSLNNFDVSSITSQFLSLDPSHADFLKPDPTGALASGGGNEVPATFSITHPEGHTLTEADFPSITSTLGAIEDV